jgi:catechol 2,3-dioxygenase-like lactoylglutathione lyase family enzyme
LGERSLDDGVTWQLQTRFLARRTVVPAVQPMLDHVSIGVSDIEAAKRFYDTVLQPLGYRCLYEDPATLGYGGTETSLWLYAVARPVPPAETSGLHFCFAAPSPEGVDAFHAAALRAGGRDNGQPGLRPDYGPEYLRRVRG